MRSRCFMLISAFLFPVIVLLAGNVYAGDEWETILQDLSKDDQITPNEEQVASLYGATVTYTVRDNDGEPNNFSGDDTVVISVKGNGINLDPGQSFTKEELIEWSKENAAELFKAVFGNAPDTTISGMTDSQAITQQLFSTVYAAPEPTGMKFTTLSNKDIVLKGQYDFLEISGVDANGASGIMGYEYKFRDRNRNSIGISVPYRQLSLDDNIDSKYNYIAFLPFFKHRWYPERSIVEWVAQVTVGFTYIESTLFPDGGGYLEYGGGTGVKYAYAVNERISVNTGVLLHLLKKDIPSDIVPEDLQWISDTLTDLPTEITLTPSFGVFMALIPDKLFFRGDVFRNHQLQDDVISGYENQTVVIGGLTYRFPKGSRVSLGYKRSFEMEDITDQSLIFDLNLRW